MAGEEFDIDAFLSQPLTARIATNGPTVRPTWFLWEDQAFWILTGPWARLPRLVHAPWHVARHGEHEPHRLVAGIGGGAEHARAAALDHRDAVLPAILGGCW